MNERQVVILPRLKFEDVMEYYPKHNRDVYESIRALHANKGLTPFVGAGLSVFCGYKLWPSVLGELADYIPNKKQKNAAATMIKQGKLLEAAQHIQNSYSRMLSRLTHIVDYQKIDACPPERMWASADWVLPYLFDGCPVMTTNFDRILEHVFSKNAAAFERSLDPYDPSLLTQMRQKKSHGIFKLHGDIGEKTTSMDRLVFTQNQYEQVYDPNGEMVRELKQWYENQTLLFLGCSLAADKTMEVLKEVVAANPGVTHYAIVDCPKKKLAQRVEELAQLGIDAIFYDSSNHDAVRVILERLLEETDPEGYKKLWASRPRARTRRAEERPMMYDSGFIPFTGRRKEWEALDAFCSDDGETCLWWAVTGPGGMGKSRLVYEFTNEKRTQGWEVKWFSQRELDNIAAYIPGVKPTIVVLDDVQAHMQTVGQWMVDMADDPRSEKLRILLLEREGKGLDSASWLRTMQSDAPYGDFLRDWCHDGVFLCLEAMADDNLKTIMNNYAAASGKAVNAELLLQTLEKVDPELKRPLYALAIADTRCSGKDPTNWDRTKILDTLLTRELKFHIERLQGMTGAKISKTLQTEFENLLARSCVRGILTLEDIPAERYPRLYRLMDSQNMDPFEFFEGIGIARKQTFHTLTADLSTQTFKEGPDEEKEIIALDCPDLIKEHLLLQQALERKQMELLPDGWENDPGQLFLLNHLLADYTERLKDQRAFWDAVLKASPMQGIPAWLYSRTLWGITAVLPDMATEAADHLAALYADSQQDTMIAVSYANGLFNMSLNQPPEKQRNIIEQLKKLNTAHPDQQDIAVVFAKALSYSTDDQTLDDCIVTVSGLEELYTAHSKGQEFARSYANGLCNLAIKQPLDEKSLTVSRLGEVYAAHSDCRDIAIIYATGLAWLSRDQSAEACRNTVDRLKHLLTLYPECVDVADHYGYSLFALSGKQSPGDRSQTVNEAEKLYAMHTDNTGVAKWYASVLYWLACDQPLEDRGKTVATLKQLHIAHPENQGVTEHYACGLYAMAYGQTGENRMETVGILKELYAAHQTLPDVAKQYANGLVALMSDQSLEDREKTVSMLKQLYMAHPDHEELASRYADGLSWLSDEQSLNEQIHTTANLQNLYDTHPQNEHVAAIYAGALIRLALAQESEADVRRTLVRSEEMLVRYPANERIQLFHAMTWFNLTLQQSEADIPGTVEEIAAYLRQHPGAIPGFKDALDKYLAKHPEHTARYQPLQEL